MASSDLKILYSLLATPHSPLLDGHGFMAPCALV